MPSNCGAVEDSLGQGKDQNQAMLREINPEYSLEGLVLKRKLYYFGHVLETGDSLKKSLLLGKNEGRRRRGHQGMRWLDGYHRCNRHELGQTSGDGIRGREAWHTAVHGVAKSQTGLND